MKFLVVFACSVALCASQYVDPKVAKILKEQRFNAGDGRAGAAFATEDGVLFREETDVNGDRIGEYSYTGAEGKKYTVRYSAGKEGFRIISGDHIPSGGQNAARYTTPPPPPHKEEEIFPIEPEYVEQQRIVEQPRTSPKIYAPRADVQTRPVQRQQFREVRQQQIQYQPQQYQPQVQQQHEVYQPHVQQQQFSQEVQLTATNNRDFNPFINPHDPTHKDFKYNTNALTFNPRLGEANKNSLVPNCADCEGLNPFINPYDKTHKNAVKAIVGLKQLADTGYSSTVNIGFTGYPPQSAPVAHSAQSVPQTQQIQGDAFFTPRKGFTVQQSQVIHEGKPITQIYYRADRKEPVVKSVVVARPRSHSGSKARTVAKSARPAVPVSTATAAPAAAQSSQLISTLAPARHFPPGKLKLNRFETGYNFDFES